MRKLVTFLSLIPVLFSCSEVKTVENDDSVLKISREKYKDQLEGFWLGQSLANWTGLITEMDKIGNIGEIKTGDFYTRENWGKKDQPSIWGQGIPSDLSENIDFILRAEDEVWGADDDTDIEYMYQHLLFTHGTALLTPEQIRDGWLKHIKEEEENYLWVSNQQAFDLMIKGIVPPETSKPEINPYFDMIDAQLTTEIFGLFSPGRPDFAQKMSYLPIRTSARYDAAWISEFYVRMHSLVSISDTSLSMKERIMWMAQESRKEIPDTSYTSKMYDYVLSKYKSGIPWEAARDSIYVRYQVEQKDGYDLTSKELYCNGCFAAGINYAASLVSLFYGEGDYKETIKIGVLAGWDSDNPSATSGGLIGFMIGKEEIERIFDKKLSDKFDIHRTRKAFPLEEYDNFGEMADKGIKIIDIVVNDNLHGRIDEKTNSWIIPKKSE